MQNTIITSDSSTPPATPTWLAGKLLIAMPGMPDDRFDKTLIFVCAHDAKGAMGLVINQALDGVPISALFEQLRLQPRAGFADFPVLKGGPVQVERGVLLHTADTLKGESICIEGGYAVTGTLDALREVVAGAGPQGRLFALGYAGWGAGQLESELARNAWLVVDADTDLVFETPLSDKWQKALQKLGIDPAFLTTHAGSA